MLNVIREKLNNIFDIFQLSLDQFNEDKINFYFSNEINLMKINLIELKESCSLFADSIQITMRNLDVIKLTGNSSEEEVNEFKHWIDQNTGGNVTLTINFSKADFSKKYFEEWHTEQYSINLFVNPISFKKVLSYEKMNSQLLSGKKHVIVLLPFYELDCVKNNFITIIGNKTTLSILELMEGYSYTESRSQIDDRTQKQKLYCNMGNLFDAITPDYFYFKDQPDDDLHDIFNTLNYFLILLCMHYISNISSKQSFYIHGYKNIHITAQDITNKIARESAFLAYQLYNSIYEVQTQDKLLITRNVISIHLANESSLHDFIQLLPELFVSITSNFDSYIKDKIKSFFDKKKDLEKYIRDTSEAISKQISGASENLNKSWLTLAGALLAGIITYTTRGAPLLLAFFVISFGIISYSTLHYSIWVTEQEKNLLKESYTHFLSLIDGVNEQEVNKIKGNIVDDKFKLLEKIIKKMILFKTLLPFILLIAIVTLLSINYK